MNERDRLSEEELHEVFAALAAGGEEHPLPARLGAFVRGELPAGEQEPMELHLATCRECTDRVLEMRSSAIEAQPGADLTGEGLADEALAAEDLTAEVDAVVSRAFPKVPLAPPRSRLSRGLLTRLAAALAVVALGLGLWALSLASENSRLRSALVPQAGAAVVDLYPASYRPRGGEGPQRIPLPPGAQWVTVLLTPPADAQTFSAYRLVVEDETGKPLWQGAASPGEPGSFTLLLPRRLAAGEVRFRLLGVGGESESLIEEYRAVFEEP